MHARITEYIDPHMKSLLFCNTALVDGLHHGRYPETEKELKVEVH